MVMTILWGSYKIQQSERRTREHSEVVAGVSREDVRKERLDQMVLELSDGFYGLPEPQNVLWIEIVWESLGWPGPWVCRPGSSSAICTLLLPTLLDHSAG